MAVLQFNKQALGNLEYALQREVLSTNRAGGYMNTTLVCCNTRRYHGLMVCPVPELADQDDFVLLSSLDETVIQHDQEFHLAIHRFPGNFEPRGHKYIVDFCYTPTPTITYRVGGVLLKKELLWVHAAQQLLVRYTLLEASSETRLRLRPFLAFRSRGALSCRNDEADGRTFPVEQGVRVRLYGGFPWLNMQLSKTEARFVATGDGNENGDERGGEWYYNFEYPEEKRRGYEATEDLLTPGYFEMGIAPGESVIFSGATAVEHDPRRLACLFDQEIARRSVKTEFLPALYHSARQFLIFTKDHTTLTAGYPWYNARSRETFMALAGITLTQELVETCVEVLDYHVENRLRDGMFGTHFAADTQLWFFYTLQRLEQKIGRGQIWAKYGGAMKEILEHYRQGVGMDHRGRVVRGGRAIHQAANGLIWAEEPGRALTWMNSMVGGEPVTPRGGFAVEVNALWYNAVCYALELARGEGTHEKGFVAAWEALPELIRENFAATFWLDAAGLRPAYLADYVGEGGRRNADIRPNQLLACSLDYSPLGELQRGQVMRVVENYLLTPRGIRTLSPNDPRYKGHCRGDADCRARARHEGTVYAWLLEHYVRAGIRLYGLDAFRQRASDILYGFEEDLLSYGIGSAAEKYDGDAPHEGCGAISYAPSVAALLTIHQLVK